MEATRCEQVIVEDGELRISGLPHKRGEVVEVIILPQRADVMIDRLRQYLPVIERAARRHRPLCSPAALPIH